MITSLGEERANLSAFRMFVRFVLVWICRFPLPLGVWEGLRFVIVALPGLFSYLLLENLGTRAMYADTDSVIFTTKQGQLKPELNGFLGDCTDEMPGNSIITSISGGPKNYGYELAKPDENGTRTLCKIHSITLNYKNSLMLTSAFLRL